MPADRHGLAALVDTAWLARVLPELTRLADALRRPDSRRRPSLRHNLAASMA